MGRGIGDAAEKGKGMKRHTIAAVITDRASRCRLAGGEETLGAPGPGRRDVGHVFRSGSWWCSELGSWIGC